MKNPKTFTSIFMITLVLSLVIFIANQPSASACNISLGKRIKFDMELSPKVPLFNPAKDGYFYPGSPKITKNLKVINVGDVPFRICHFKATFYNDTHLATGLQIKIMEHGTSKCEKSHLLCNGTLSNLSEGVEVSEKETVPPGKSVTLQITVWMPETAGNEYQGLSMTADIAVTVRFPPANNGENK
jgi:predicted thioesterase